jgi:hypothetical protein
MLIYSKRVIADYLQVPDVQRRGENDALPGMLVRQEAVAQWVEAGVDRPPVCAVESEGRNQGSAKERAGATADPNRWARHLHSHLQTNVDRRINTYTHTYICIYNI